MWKEVSEELILTKLIESVKFQGVIKMIISDNVSPSLLVHVRHTRNLSVTDRIVAMFGLTRQVRVNVSMEFAALPVDCRPGCIVLCAVCCVM